MENRYLYIFRYIILGLLVLGFTAFNKRDIDEIGVILLLLFIINSNLRFFSFKDKKFFVFSSLLLEIILVGIIYRYYGGIALFYFVTGILDGVLLLGERLSVVACGLLTLAVFFITWEINYELSILNTGISIVLFFLALYIKYEHNQRLAVEKLYNSLKISEEKLKKANMDLEIYADSISELAVLRERNRISREIHDSVGHRLSTIIIQLGAIEKLARENGDIASEMASNLRSFAREGLEEIRKAIRELKPAEMEKYQPIMAIESLTRQFSKLTGVDVKLGFSREKKALNEKQSFVVYRVVQEFISNSVRHGKATKINIFMNFGEDELILTLRDNGVGNDSIQKGMGLTNIWERVSELGGQVQYSTEKGKGFLLRVVLKLDKEYTGEEYGCN